MQRQTFILKFCENLTPSVFAGLSSLLRIESSTFEKLGIFASLHRKFGDEIPKASVELRDSWVEANDLPYPDHWTLTDWARLCFLWSCFEADPEFLSEDTLTRLIRRGDHSEQTTLARVLFYLPEAGRFKEQAQLWLATNSSEIFSSLALNNPFPATFFEDLYFRQMVVKALFIDLPTQPIIGLRERMDSELYRMSQDYKRERQIAGRSLPIGMPFLEELSK